jgi:hypothetical protein
VLHTLEVYCDTCRVADEGVIGNGTVEYQGYPFATYAWLGDTDIPVFDFVGKNAKVFAWNQKVRQPFLDDTLKLHNLDYIIQELSRIYSVGGNPSDSQIDNLLGLGISLDKHRDHIVQCGRGE